MTSDRDFALNIRQDFSDDTDLRASLVDYGWLSEFPAIQDEHGGTLVGNRRLRIATEEGIRPVIKVIQFGDGKDADAERIKLALVSNLGAAPMSPKDRQRIAEYLWGERGWTMGRIGAALKVCTDTISSDLSGFRTIRKPHRPKGGRPKSEPNAKTPKSEKGIEVKNVSGKQNVNTNLTPKIEVLLSDGRLHSLEDIADACGIEPSTESTSPIQRALRRLKQGKNEVIEETVGDKVFYSIVDGYEIDPKTLSKSAQEKLEALIRKQNREFEMRVEQRAQEMLREDVEATILPAYKREMDEARMIVKSRDGVMKRSVYVQILACLHPDRVKGTELEERYQKAFTTFKNLELALCSEKELPTTASSIPRTWAEMQARKAEVKAKRRRNKQTVSSARH